jgi:hypothetical protein
MCNFVSDSEQKNFMNLYSMQFTGNQSGHFSEQLTPIIAL